MLYVLTASRLETNALREQSPNTLFIQNENMIKAYSLTLSFKQNFIYETNTYLQFPAF